MAAGDPLLINLERAMASADADRLMKFSFRARRIAVHDVIETPGHLGPRLYSVDSVCLGAILQEDVIGLKVIDRTPANGCDGVKQEVLYVPKEMIEAGLSTGLFTLTTLEETVRTAN